VCRTRAESLGIELKVVETGGGDAPAHGFGFKPALAGLWFQYPTTDGRITGLPRG